MIKALLITTLLTFSFAACQGETAPATSNAAETPAPSGGGALKEMGPWEAGDTIASGVEGVRPIEILEVHANGTGDVAGTGRTASLRYKCIHRSGRVLDHGKAPFTFVVGAGKAIKGWDVVVPTMRVGDSLTLIIPKELAYGDRDGDLKFDMELLSIK